MTVLILCREETEDVVQLSSELSNRGIQTISSTPKEIAVRCCDGQIDFLWKKKKLNIDLVIGWVSLHARQYGLWLLHAFEKLRIPVINGQNVLTNGQNKFLNSIVLNQHNIPHMQTYLIGSMTELENALDKLGFPVVIKPVIGAKGQGVQCIHDYEMLVKEIRPYFDRHYPVYLQEFVKKPDRDIRVRVVNYKADYAFYRFVGDDGFLSNLSRGGSWEECVIDERLRKISEYSAEVFNAPIAGVDLIESGEGDYRVIEVNTTPAITYPYDETVKKVADLIQQEFCKVCNSARTFQQGS